MTGRRDGYSLLEVLIATAILAGAAMVLAGMISTGSRAGVEARTRTIGAGIVASVIDETIALGRYEPEEQEGTIVGDETWAWRLRIEPIPEYGMLRLIAEAKRADGEGADAWSAGGGSAPERGVARLVRWTALPSGPSNDTRATDGATGVGR